MHAGDAADTNHKRPAIAMDLPVERAASYPIQLPPRAIRLGNAALRWSQSRLFRRFHGRSSWGKMVSKPMAIRADQAMPSVPRRPRGIREAPPPPARRSLIPILAGVAVVLAIAVAGVVALYVLGYFDRGGTRSALITPAPTVAQPLTPAQFPATTTSVAKTTVTSPPATADEPPVRSTHGDWQIRCDTPAGAAREQCVLMQFVTAEDRDNVGLTVIVLKTPDGQSRIMRVLAPLGVLLPSGLGLKIDDADMGRAGFVRCLPDGCVAEVMLDDNLLKQLGTGKTATFVIFQTPQEGIGIPISLNGFQDGYAALP
jgi:invasion protein IalB